MGRVLALLGSINVGGNRLKMAELAAALDAAGLGPVETVIASGNVLLPESVGDPAAIEAAISAVLAKQFGLAVLVTVRTSGEVRAAVLENPFHGDGEDRFVHSIFLDRQPEISRFEKLLEDHKDRGSERLALGPRVLYLDYVHGAGVSSLTGPFLERRLGCKGTARNMRSLKRILEKIEA